MGTSVPAREELRVPDAATSEPRLIVYGKVKLADGKPAAGADVQLTENVYRYGFTDEPEQPLAHTTAEKDGSYVLATTATQMVGVCAWREGAGRITIATRLDSFRYGLERAVDERVRVDITLPTAVVLSGRVVDEAGNPVSSATLKIGPTIADLVRSSQSQKPRPDSSETTSTSDGSFRFDSLPAGTYSLSVDHPDYVPASLETQVPQTDVLMTLAKEGGAIEGRVAMLGTGQGVSGAEVRLRGTLTAGSGAMKRRKTITNDAGAFRFERMPSGTFAIQAEKGLLQSLQQTDLIKIRTRETTTGITLLLYPGHTIKGVVTDATTKTPLPGVEVSDSSPNSTDKKRQTTQTDSEGRYRLGRQFNRTVALYPVKAGYGVKQDKTNPWKNLYVSLTPDKLEAQYDIEMTPMVVISGFVKDENGHGIAGAEISRLTPAGNGGALAHTDSHGLYRADVQSFSTVRLKASLSGLPPAFGPLLQIEDEPLSAPDIVVKASGLIMGTVEDPSGLPVGGASVSSNLQVEAGEGYQSKNALPETISDASGNFMIPSVPEGDIHLIARKEGFAASVDQTVNVKSGETKNDIRLKLRKALTISGKVFDAAGKPVAMAMINAISQTSNYLSATSDAEGRYRIDGVADEEYGMSAYYDQAHAQKNGIKGGSDNVDFVLGADTPQKTGERTGTFIGRVLDWKTRQPVADYEVTLVEHFGIDMRPKKDPVETGKFTIDGIRMYNQFRIKITGPGYMPVQSEPIFLQSDRKPMEREFLLGPGGIISGRVIDALSRQPLADVKVALMGIGEEHNLGQRSPEQVGRTSTDGTFSFEKVTAGKNWVDLHKGDSAIVRRSIQVQQGTVADFGDIEIGAPTAITGKLIRVPGDAPIPGQTITVKNSSVGYEKTVTTDELGEFRIDDLTAGYHNVACKEHGVEVYMQVEDGKTAEVVLKVGAGILAGTVLRRGSPAERCVIEIKLDGQSITKKATADAQGKFQIDGLAPGTWNLSFYPRDISGPVGIATPAFYEQLEKVEIQGRLERTFHLPGGVINGKVVDSRGAAVPKAAVKLISPQQIQVFLTDDVSIRPDGTFQINGLPGGEYRLSARESNAGYAEVKVTVAADRDVAAALQLRSGGGTLVSTALDMQGLPIRDAWCQLSTSDGQFSHDETRNDSGVVTVSNIPPGSYKVEVSNWKYSISTRNLEIKEGQTVRIDDVLYPAGSLRWAVTDSAGAPMKDVSCTLTPQDASSIEKPRSGNTTENNGVWIVRGLSPGEYTATARSADGRTATSNVTIAVGEIIQISTVMK